MNKPFPATKDATVKSFIIYFIYIFKSDYETRKINNELGLIL